MITGRKFKGGKMALVPGSQKRGSAHKARAYQQGARNADS